jgi:hypothetical protein
MRRTKQHRAVLKRLLRDDRLTPKRAHLANKLLKKLDSIEPEDMRLYELQLLNMIGAPIEEYVAALEKPDEPSHRILRDEGDDGGHITINNRLLRNQRVHPNYSLSLQVESMWEDAETKHERAFYRLIVTYAFSDGRGLVVVDRDDDPVQDNVQLKHNQELLSRARANLALITGGKDAGTD